MQPLEPYRSHLVTISGMKAPDGNPDMGGVHMGASAAWLNGIGPVTEQAKFVDPVEEEHRSVHRRQDRRRHAAAIAPGRAPRTWARRPAPATAIPCVFFNTISWRDDTSPLPVAVNPRVTFERIFGETGSASRRLANMRRKQSLLDSVAEEAAGCGGSSARPTTSSSTST